MFLIKYRITGKFIQIKDIYKVNKRFLKKQNKLN